MEVDADERKLLYAGDVGEFDEDIEHDLHHHHHHHQHYYDAMGDDDSDTSSSIDSDQLEIYRKKLQYLIERLPENYITEDLKYRLTEINTPTPLSSISDDILENLTHMQEEDDGKNIRELFYEVMFTKHFKFNPPLCYNTDIISNSSSDVDVFENEGDLLEEEEEEGEVKGKLVEGEMGQEQEEEEEQRGEEEEHKCTHKRKPTLMTARFEADERKSPSKKRSAIFIDFYPDNYLTELLNIDIELPPADIVDQYNVKSFQTVLKENFQKDNGRTYSLHTIVCLFSYNNRPLNDNESPIELEIVDMIHNMNYNTLKPSNLTSIITGCVIVNNGMGIICLELSLFDAIRLIATLNWSKFMQKVNKVKIFSNISFTSSKFKVFVMCRPLLIEEDDREFPVLIGDEVDSSVEQSKKVREYLQEVSFKLGKTFTILGHQSEFHECGIGELPPCATEHLPSRKLLEWTLDCPLLKPWSELLDEILEPEPFFEFTNDSYPFPTDLFNLRNLFFLDDYKDEIIEMYKNGFRPKFSETEPPEMPVPPFFKSFAEQSFQGRQKFVAVNMKNIQLNL